MDLWIDRQLNIFIPERYARYLTREQRDGIKFMYAQKKKNRQGVILNDPVFQMSLVQAFLFVNAIKSSKKSNLVLCSKMDIGHICGLFNLWTDDNLSYVYKPWFMFVPDVTYLVESSSPEKWSTKKNWGILIVCHQDTENYSTLFDVDAEFKIVITARNVKTHFEEFADIYKWINSKDKITPKLYKTVNQSLRQRIMFESMLEVSVLRRDSDHIPRPYTQDFANMLQFIKRDVYFALFEPSYEFDMSKSFTTKIAKNKDSTGLKIKKSTKSVNSTETTVIPERICDDVELFIRNNPPIQIDDIENRDLKNLSDMETYDIEVDEEEIFRSMTPETVANDEGITPENIEDVVMNSTTFNNNHEGSSTPQKNHVDRVETDVKIKSKISQDNINAFDANMKEIEETASKKYRGSVLDSIF